MNSKEEADKIIQEILKIVGSNCEHDSYCDDKECNRVKGITICNVDYEKARKLAMLQVNSNIKQIERMYPHVHYGSELKKFQSILTELEITK